jgi:hypothetical protein
MKNSWLGSGKSALRLRPFWQRRDLASVGFSTRQFFAAASLLRSPPRLLSADKSLTEWLTVTLGLSSPSWRILCAAASICSVMATVATQLLKSHNVEEHVARAQGCRAKLEVLEIGLTVGQLDIRQATTEYLKCVEDAAFLETA